MMGKTRKRALVALLASVFLLASVVPSQAALDWRTSEEMNLETAVAAKENLLPSGMFVTKEDSLEPKGWNVSGTAAVTAGDGVNGTNSVAVSNASYIISENIPTYGEALVLAGYYYVRSVPENTQVKLNVQIYGDDAEGEPVKYGTKAYSMSEILEITKATDGWTFFSYELPNELNGTAIATLRIWLRNTTSADAEAATIKFSSVRVCTDPWAGVPENVFTNSDFQDYTEENGEIKAVKDWGLTPADGVITAKKESDGNVYVEMYNNTTSKKTMIYRTDNSGFTAVDTNATYRLSFSMKNTLDLPSTRLSFYDATSSTALGQAQQVLTMKPLTPQPSVDTWTEYEGFFTTKGTTEDEVARIKLQLYCDKEEGPYHIDNVKLIKTSSKIGFADAAGKTLTAVPAGGVASVEAVLLPKAAGKAPTLFVCEYTPEKQLKQIIFGTVQDLKDVSLSAGGYQYKGTADISGIAATSTLKAFAWDGVSGMQPIALKILRPAEG